MQFSTSPTTIESRGILAKTGAEAAYIGPVFGGDFLEIEMEISGGLFDLAKVEINMETQLKDLDGYVEESGKTSR